MKMLSIVAALLGLGALLVVPLRLAADPTHPIVVKDAWIRATPNGAKVAGGYVTITNTGAEPDHLIAASVPTAASAEIHTMSMENGVMHMSRLAEGLAIAPGATVTLQPGGTHMMFMNPTLPFKESETVHGTLTFAKAGVLSVTFVVAGMAAKSPPGPAHDGMGHAGMDGMDMKMK